jgi:hypothetical protein
MTSIDISNARAIYKAGTEAEMLQMMAKTHGCRLIYQYANDYGDKLTLTDYKVIMSPGDPQEQEFLNNSKVHNAILVFKDGKVVYEPLERPSADGDPSPALPILAPTPSSSDQEILPEVRCSICGKPVQSAETFCSSCGNALPLQKDSSASGQSIPPQKLPGVPTNSVQPLTKSSIPPGVGKLDLGGNKSASSASASPRTANDLKKDLRGWGIGLIIWGLLSFILSQYLDPVWGGMIIILGIINLIAINRTMFIINGTALFIVGILNIISVISAMSTSGVSSFWLAYGTMQIGWGFQEILKFDKFSPMRQFSAIPVGRSGAVARFAIIPVERKQIENHSFVGRYPLNQSIERLARFWVNQFKPNRAELMISGYYKDPRELFEIPEVCVWARRVVNEYPVLPYFLTPTSLDRFTCWLCGPVSKDEIATPDFEDRFVQTQKKHIDIALQASTAYFRWMGVSTVDVDKLNSMVTGDPGEFTKIGLDGHSYTATVLSKNEMQKYRKQLPRMVMRQNPWTVFAGVILGILLFGGIIVAVFWASNHFPKPSIVTPLIHTPVLSNTQNSSGQVCWLKETTGIDGNRSLVWEQYLDEPTKKLMPFELFKDDVVINNPILISDGYVFFSQKTYLLPELCP